MWRLAFNIGWVPLILPGLIQDYSDGKIGGLWASFILFVCFKETVEATLEFSKSHNEAVKTS